MDLIEYLDKYVIINLASGFYFKGKVISADENSISIIDINGQRVCLKEDSILSIREAMR